MLSGTLEVWLDELECHTLHVGDSFWFESSHGHRWFNPGDQAAVLLWINTPPTSDDEALTASPLLTTLHLCCKTAHPVRSQRRSTQDVQ
jgi:hypothetical protein